MKMDAIRVPMHPHGPIIGPKEAYHLQKAFYKVPGPLRRQKLAKTDKKRRKSLKTNIFPYLFLYFSVFLG